MQNGHSLRNTVLFGIFHRSVNLQCLYIDKTALMLLPFLLSDRMGFFFPQKQGNCLDDKTVSNVQCHGHQKKTPQQQPSATDLRSACKEIDPKWLVNIFAECIMHHSGRRRSGENAKEEAKIRTT